MYRLHLPSVALALLLAACADAPSPTQAPAPAADSAFALLAGLDADAVAAAYRRLDGLAHTAEVRLTVSDDAGTRTATRTLARRPTGDGIEERLVVTEGDTTLLRDWTERLRPANPLPALLPEEPAFLVPRSREDYRYAVGPDTVVGGSRLRVVEAALRPGGASEQAVRRARYFLRPGTGDVLGVEVVRASASAIFDEAGWARVLLQPGPDGAPVPALAVVETTVDVPGAPPRRVRLEQRFRDVRAD
ncbi:MAG TPA: hypothetical protein VK002_10640 [Rubricoccaceae bacterium]|nr:hypothetical protein [Rubricoccaceae bacterium]